MSDATTTSATKAAARIGSELPSPTPPISAETAGFWKATTRRGGSSSRAATRAASPPGTRVSSAPTAGTLDVTWEEASGRGEIHSFTVVRRGGLGAYAGGPPYVLAYVELVEGVRMMTNIVDVDEADLRIGLPVTVVFHETDGEAALPRFVPIRR